MISYNSHMARAEKGKKRGAVYVRQIGAEELKGWLLYEDGQVIVINKPGDVVCHPSKAGPVSSLAGAVREYLGITPHLVYRLDRETSGIVVFARDAAVSRRLQGAQERRAYSKAYLAILSGELCEEAVVDEPLGPAGGAVLARTAVIAGGKAAVSRFVPLSRGGGFTLARVIPATGRKHQIRAHAQWLGYPLVGDKIYGPDERCFLEFLETGWTPELERRLLLPRQALHCAEISFPGSGLERTFRAPMPEDMEAFCRSRGIEVQAG